jgi:hypothetical protein
MAMLGWWGHQSLQLGLHSEANPAYIRFMWTWQHQDWPNFRYDAEACRPRVDAFRLRSERLMGRMEALPADLRTDAVIGLMLS